MYDSVESINHVVLFHMVLSMVLIQFSHCIGSIIITKLYAISHKPSTLMSEAKRLNRRVASQCRLRIQDANRSPSHSRRLSERGVIVKINNFGQVIKDALMLLLIIFSFLHSYFRAICCKSITTLQAVRSLF